MAFTSGVLHGGADSQHSVELQANGHTRNLRLYDRTGDDMLSHKGDLWKLNLSDFHFIETCIKFADITRVSIIESSDDGWNIDSIVTFVKDSEGGVEVLTQNLDVFRWIDGDAHYTHRRFELTHA